MAQSLSKVYIHIIFHIASSSVPIKKEVDEALYNYMGGILKELDCVPIKINGMPDHIHLLFVLSRMQSIANVVEQLKINSTRWLKEKDSCYQKFAWQHGYGAFSVSASICENVKQYIEQQESHHAKHSYQDELREFFRRYKIEYNEKYVWND